MTVVQFDLGCQKGDSYELFCPYSGINLMSENGLEQAIEKGSLFFRVLWESPEDFVDGECVEIEKNYALFVDRNYKDKDIDDVELCLQSFMSDCYPDQPYLIYTASTGLVEDGPFQSKVSFIIKK